MAYVVTMTYKDEKAVNIKIKEEEIEKFFNVKEGESDVKVANHAHESTAKLPGEEDRPEGSEEGASEG